VSNVVDAYVEHFNAAVRSGDWTAFANSYTEDATVVFTGAPASPMHGRREIAAGYAASPPNDTITVTDQQIEGDQVLAHFVWDAAPHQPGGAFRLTIRDGLVAENHIELR
jgi:steroid Delta-isomerase